MTKAVSLGILLFWPLAAVAAEGDDEESTQGSSDAMDDPAVVSSTSTADATVDEPRSPRPKDDRWVHRWPPEANTAELGAYGGLYRAGPNHELFESDMALPEQGFKPYSAVSGVVGARIGYYPLRFFGVEAEGGASPTETNTFERATLWHARGSAVAQLARWSLTPFVLVGGGALGVSSARSAVGDDVDPSLHFGGGLKAYINRRTQVRFDLRDVVGHQRGVSNGFRNHSFEALLGVSVVLGRSKQEPAQPVDTDGDGWLDPDDRCVLEPGVVPDGCPIRDSDGDGFVDPEDRCVNDPGIAPDGCPLRDSDGDGFLDPDDQCVDEPGEAPAGCPILDTDGDGLLDPDDKCVHEPETANGFEDADGCPDQMPSALQQFNGVMEGINFKSSKATILPESLPRLNQAASVMKEFPSFRVEISGHTDSSGDRDKNWDLSRRRADAVRDYLIGRGVAADRLQTRGAGQEEPIADNASKKGRAKNRRIEFKVLTADGRIQ